MDPKIKRTSIVVGIVMAVVFLWDVAMRHATGRVDYFYSATLAVIFGVMYYIIQLLLTYGIKSGNNS